MFPPERWWMSRMPTAEIQSWAWSPGNLSHHELLEHSTRLRETRYCDIVFFNLLWQFSSMKHEADFVCLKVILSYFFCDSHDLSGQVVRAMLGCYCTFCLLSILFYWDFDHWRRWQLCFEDWFPSRDLGSFPTPLACGKLVVELESRCEFWNYCTLHNLKIITILPKKNFSITKFSQREILLHVHQWCYLKITSDHGISFWHFDLKISFKKSIYFIEYFEYVDNRLIFAEFVEKHLMPSWTKLHGTSLLSDFDSSFCNF